MALEAGTAGAVAGALDAGAFVGGAFVGGAFVGGAFVGGALSTGGGPTGGAPGILPGIADCCAFCISIMRFIMSIALARAAFDFSLSPAFSYRNPILS